MNNMIIWTVLPNGTAASATLGGPGKGKMSPPGSGLPHPLPPGTSITGAVLKLSVLISPRLYGTGTQLSAYNPPWRHWPTTLSSLISTGFQVKFSGLANPVPAQLDPHSVSLREDLWDALFSDTTPVTPYAYQDNSNRFIQSHPVRDVLSFMKQRYQATNPASPDGGYYYGLPNITDLLSSFNPNWADNYTVNGVDLDTVDLLYDLTSYKTQFSTYRSWPPASVNSGTPGSLYQMRWYHYRPPFTPTQGPVAPVQPQPDFHQALSALAKYPTLMRMLGLIIDLEVSTSGIPAGGGAATVQLVPPSVSGYTNQTPPTYYTYNASAGVFAATPQGTSVLQTDGSGNSIGQGVLNLAGTGPDGNMFDLIQLDVDEAMLRIVEFLRNAERTQDLLIAPNPDGGTHQAVGTDTQAGLPHLRANGLAIAEYGRAYKLALALPKATSNNSVIEGTSTASFQPFYAEDLIRGYRIDIQDAATGTWHALCRRAPAYYKDTSTSPPSLKQYPGSYYFSTLNSGGTANLSNFVNATDGIGEDEGFVSLTLNEDPSAATSTSAPRDFYLHEHIFRWQGWSLVAQLPGQHVASDSNALSSYDPSANLPAGLNMATYFAAKAGSLPRLRFGKTYRARARVVDLAGNSLPFNSSVSVGEIPSSTGAPLTYLRFEPIPSPAVVLRKPLADVSRNPISPNDSPGESAERMVIRSDYGKTTSQYVTYLQNLPAPPDLPTGTTWHGFVPYYADSERHLAPPRTSEQMAEQHGMFDTASGGTFNGSAATYNLVTGLDKGIDQALNAATDTRGHVYVDHDQLTLPYLPDPLARGVAFLGLPGEPANTVFTQSFAGTWPSMLPFRLVVVGIPYGQTPGKPTFTSNSDGTNGALTVQVPQGQTFTVRYMSYCHAADLAFLGLWDWLTEGLSATQVSQLQTAAAQGLLWQLTPFREITLTHAVQRPLVLPVFQGFSATKANVGDTFATVQDGNGATTIMPIDGNSTIKVDLVANWTEPIDNPFSSDPAEQAGPVNVNGQKHVLDIPVAQTDTHVNPSGSPAGIYGTHQFGDTKHRRVTYTTVATSRYREYLPFSDAEISDGYASITQTSAAATVHVVSSARPDAPKVLYVVPAFEWSTTASGNTSVSQRLGGRLRVYLDRPWYSSGADELLGVVIYQAPPGAKASAQPRMPHAAARRPGERLRAIAESLQRQTVQYATVDQLKPYITQWGLDPIWASSSLDSALPAVQHFPLADPAYGGLTRQSLSLAEFENSSLSATRVSVAGHAVGFDATRRLWYSDIEINWGQSYMPFVRLALARFQPYSLPNGVVDLSRIVLADFVQLAPDRVATIKTRFDPRNPKRVSVSVFGISYTGASSGSLASVEVSIQEQMSGSPGEFGWVPVPNSTYTLAEQPSGNNMLWQGDVYLPRSPGTIPFRLVIKEYEQFLADYTDSAQRTTVRRLVYASEVQI